MDELNNENNIPNLSNFNASNSPYGNDPYGQNPYDQNAFNQDPYGMNPYNQDPYGMLDQNNNLYNIQNNDEFNQTNDKPNLDSINDPDIPGLTQTIEQSAPDLDNLENPDINISNGSEAPLSNYDQNLDNSMSGFNSVDTSTTSNYDEDLESLLNAKENNLSDINTSSNYKPASDLNEEENMQVRDSILNGNFASDEELQQDEMNNNQDNNYIPGFEDNSLPPMPDYNQDTNATMPGFEDNSLPPMPDYNQDTNVTMPGFEDNSLPPMPDYNQNGNGTVSDYSQPMDTNYQLNNYGMQQPNMDYNQADAYNMNGNFDSQQYTPQQYTQQSNVNSENYNLQFVKNWMGTIYDKAHNSKFNFCAAIFGEIYLIFRNSPFMTVRAYVPPCF